MNAFQLTFFELTQSFPLSAKILYKNIGLRRTIKVFVLFAVRKITFRPFKALTQKRPTDRAEILTRHQLLPVLLLDSIFTKNLRLPTTQRLSILKDIVGQSGALFIQYAVKNPKPSAWHRMDLKQKNQFASNGLKQFFNAETQIVNDANASFGFDVSLCHFVALTSQLGRSDLAPLFCGADEVLFDRPELQIVMDRKKTLAQGHDRCAFRFKWDPVKDTQAS